MAWREVESRAIEQGVSARIIAMEVIQTSLLGSLFEHPASVRLSFQGGTYLRLIYGGMRYSEDLDFVCDDMAGEDLDRLVHAAGRKAADRLVSVLGTGEGGIGERKTVAGGRLDLWWFRYQRSGAREVLRVKMEFGRYPAYDVGPHSVRASIPGLLRPALVMACSKRELLADKINALAQRPYLKGRDLYDVWFLREVLQTDLDVNLIEMKFRDYHTEDPRERLQDRLSTLDGKELRREMDRFLPSSTRRLLASDGYSAVMRTVREAVAEVLR